MSEGRYDLGLYLLLLLLLLLHLVLDLLQLLLELLVLLLLMLLLGHSFYYFNIVNLILEIMAFRDQRYK